MQPFHHHHQRLLLMFGVLASPKVEPLDSRSWEEDSAMAHSFSEDSLPSSPQIPLLSADSPMPLGGFSSLKLASPFKGSLKKSPCTVYVPPSLEDDEPMFEGSKDELARQKRDHTEKRCIKWLDNHGKELTEVKEFVASDVEDSDDEQDNFFTSCTCAIQ